MVRFICVSVVVLAFWAVVSGLGPNRAGAAEAPARSPYLGGQLLVAAPKMTDPNFAETVIVMVDHNAGGAMGLIVNRIMGSGQLKTLLQGFGVESDTASGTVRLHAGGPVETGRGFVLHSADYSGPSTQKVSDGLAVSTGRDILNAIADGEGPRVIRFILGYAGWGPGQLEGEMARDDWLTAPAEPSLVFDDDVDSLWQKAVDSGGLPL